MCSYASPALPKGVTLFFFCLLLFPALAAGQDTATLRVVVSSEADGGPIPQANVVLSTPQGDTLRTGVTDLDGYHEFRRLEPGEYEIHVSFIGYETYRETFTLAEERLIHHVSLAPSAEELDEVFVEAERGVARRQAGLQTVGAADLERIPTPGPGGDLATYLQTLPGVVSGGDRGGELYIRGGTPSQNLVLVDNLPILKPFHISNLFSAFPQETISNVDMYAGGFGAEYMGATSSVIDVRLRRGNMKNFDGSAAISPYLVSAHVEGPIEVDRQSFLAVFRHSVIQETTGLFSEDPVPMRFYDLTARYNVTLESAFCNVTGVRTYDSGQIHTDLNTALSWSNTALGIRCVGFDEAFDHAYDLTAGYSRFANTEGTVGSPERSSSVDMLRLRLDHELDIAGHTMDYGFGGTMSWHAADLQERFTDFESFRTNTFTGHAYVSTEWNPHERLTVSPSIGSQINSAIFTSPTLEPRLRLSFRPGSGERQELSVALGKYHQTAEGITDERDAGTVFTFWKPSERGDPLPEARHAILGYRQQIGSSLEASLEGYVKDHRNIPVSRWTPVARLTTETTLAEGMAYGFDARLEVNRQPLYVYLGYGWSKITYEAASDDLGAWIEETIFRYAPAHDRRHQLTTVASYELGGFTGNVRWEFGSGLPYTRVYGFDLAVRIPDQHVRQNPGQAMTLYARPYGARLPTYHRLDVSVERTFDLQPNFGLEVEVGAINAYNRRNVFFFDVNVMQRVDQTPLLPYVAVRADFN